jgi:hypothetical protein
MDRLISISHTTGTVERVRARALFCGAALVLCCALSAPAAAQDYMSPELRAAVEQLKLDVAQQPTTVETMVERCDVLWPWANAWALDGGVIPNDLPLLIRASRSVDGSDGLNALPYLPFVDHYVRELQLKDEVPWALGWLSLQSEDPLQVETRQTIVQTWTVGGVPMEEGGAIYLGRDGFNNSGTPQVNDPDGNNYFTISSSNPDARFVYEEPPPSPTIITQLLAVFRLEGARLTAGDTVTMVYGDTSQGSRGQWIQSYSVSRCSFPVYLDLEGTGHFFQPAWPGVQIVGKTEPYAVAAFVPSIVAPGEPFDLTVRWEDNRYNRVSGPAPAFEIELNGEPFSSIPEGGAGLAVFEEISLSEPGVYRFSVSSADSEIQGLSNPVRVQANPPHRVFWGDTHGHIAFADGQGTPDGYFRFARDDARLDFTTLSEHTIWLDDAEWSTLQSMVATYHDPGRFIPILGNEWTVALPEGHHNIYYRDSASPRVGSQIAWLLPDLYPAIRGLLDPDDVLSIPHAHNPGNWTVSDPEIERLVEITSTHGTFEWFGNRYLSEGWQVGFVGSSDNHHEHPGYTDTGTSYHSQLGGLAAVIAPELSSDAVFDALRNRSTYATGGKRIILDATLNGAPMGSRVPFSGERRIACSVSGTAPVDTIDVIRNGEVIYQKRHVSEELEPHMWVRVGFYSSSEVFSYARPRGGRVWEGELRIEGASIRSVVAPNLENRFYEYADRRYSRRAEFLIVTRGRMDAVGLELDGADPETEIRIIVEGGTSGHSGVTTGPIDVTIGLAEATNGPAVRHFEVVDPATGRVDLDTITVQIFGMTDSLDQEFEFADLGPAAIGDSYYLRVTQIDGERAWSSPWWLSGWEPKPWRSGPSRLRPKR